MANITITTEPLAEGPPVITRYQQIVSEVITALDTILAVMPKVDEAEASERKVAFSRLGVRDAFVAAVIDAVEQFPELAGLKKLDPVAARDMFQCLEALRSLHDKIITFEKRVRFVRQWLKDSLAGPAQQIYRVAQDLASDGRSPEMAAVVANMKRAFARKGLTRAEREERRVARIQEAAAEMLQEMEVQKAA